jgi:hypothetical protein
MSTSHTLAEAYQALKATNDEITVDILGVVKNIHISSQCKALARQQSSLAKCRIWLVDDSCGNTVPSAQLVIYNKVEATKLEQENVKEGDLLRFNSVVLANNSDESNLCFRFSGNPEPGQGWACLGSLDVDEAPGTLVPRRIVGTNVARLLPGGMKTSKERIKDLVAWYSRRQHGHFDGERPAGRSKASPSKQLSPLTCRNRQLDELQASLGVLSNIKVGVTSMHSQAANMLTSNIKSRSSSKRKRQQAVSGLALALVTDESRSVMTLVDVSGRFVPQLKTAMGNQSKSRLVVTNVLTKSQNTLHGVKFASPFNETVLVTTNETAMFLVPFDPSRVLTQETQDLLSQHRNSTSEIFLISELLDLVIDGKSLKQSDQKIFSSKLAYLDAILKQTSQDSGHRQYKASAKVILDDGSIESVFLLITPSVLKCLCGGLDADELLGSDSLCNHSMTFLRSLIHEKVALKWTLRVSNQEQGNTIVVKAALHSLSGKAD